ncbi:hypothetical protein Tco_0576843 [Tanacetum coccineum]
MEFLEFFPEQCKPLEGVLPVRPSMQMTDMELDECEETTLHDTMGFDPTVIPNDSTDQLVAESLPVDTQEMQIIMMQPADVNPIKKKKKKKLNEVFTRVNDMYAILNQPGYQDEHLKVLQALLSCPMSLICTEKSARDWQKI